MNIERFKECIKRREHIEDISCGEWSEGIEECWKEEVLILSEDIHGTINFLQKDCTASEYSWISEVIEDLIEQTQSRELLSCYKDLMCKFSSECQIYSIENSIKFAECNLRKR